MIPDPSALPTRILALLFAIFFAATTFSIAISQSAFALTLALFITLAVMYRWPVVVGEMKWPLIFGAGYFLWMALASLVGPTPWRSLWSIKEEWLFLIVPVAATVFATEKWRERLIGLFAAALALFSFYAVSQYLTGMDWLNYDNGSFVPQPIIAVTGNFSHWLTFSNYYAVAAFFLLGYAVVGGVKRKFDLVLVSGASLAMFAAFLTFRRGPILYMTLGLLILAVFRSRQIRIFAVAMAVILVALVLLFPQVRERYAVNVEMDLAGTYHGGRVFIWANTLEIIEAHPVFGVGPLNFIDAYTAQIGPAVEHWHRYTHPHNDLLNVTAVAGIPALISFLGMWGSMLWLFWRGYRSDQFGESDRRLFFGALMASIVFAMSSVTEATFADEEVRQMLMAVWGAGLAPYFLRQARLARATGQTP